MGIEVAVLSLAVAAASTVSQFVQARKSAKAQREARNVQSAGEEIRNRLARRRAAREERIRRSRLVNSAEVGGVGTSSGVAGSISASQTNFGAAVAGQASQTLASQGVSAALQRASDAKARGASIKAFGNLTLSGIDVLDEEGVFG